MLEINSIQRELVNTGIVLKRGTEIEKIIENRVPKGRYTYPDMWMDGRIYHLTVYECCQVFSEVKDFFHIFTQKSLMEDNPENLKTTDKVVDFAIKHGPKAAVVTWHISKSSLERRAKKHTGRSLGDLRREYIDTHVKRALEKAHGKWCIKAIEKTLKDMGVTGTIGTRDIRSSLVRLNHV